ncbi:MAG TPA: type II toxin-antitoxin system RelE/ParE family toxin [Thermomicrobiales bacterium]
MEFRIAFYRAANGEAPIVTFLDDLRRRQPALHRLVIAGLGELRSSDYHGPPLTTRIDASGIFELRAGSTDAARVFFFFQPAQEIVCTNGYVKKTQKLDTGELDRARR